MERDYRLEIENIEDHIAQLCDSRMEGLAGIRGDFCTSKKILRILSAFDESIDALRDLRNIVEDCKQYWSPTLEQEEQAAKYPLCPFPTRAQEGYWFCDCGKHCEGCFVGAMKAENDES